MVAINFKPQFIHAVKTGSKTQTIREKARCKVGDKLQLYVGMRTKKCRKLRDAVCTGVYSIVIGRDAVLVLSGFPPKLLKNLAQKDGFKDNGEMADFFENLYGLPFAGNLITWK